ncbi:MAG TPA: acyl-CoA dehydrogenase, partial [Candidatus Microthrix parvicella]|nr:acyl-CoA dehydrogenase [Candidatus Microthrix parvicella]
YISQALDLERFTMFTYAPIKQRLDVLTEYVQEATRDGEPLIDDEVTRAKMAHLHTEAAVARAIGLKFVAAAVKVEKAHREGATEFQPPTVEASEYKLFTTEYSKRLADASMDLGAPGSQLRVKTAEAPMAGRAESTYRYTVIDTIGGGASEVQRNIIARRGLGLPRNF